ncbi:hypothetical protein [Limnoglobus roseus]|uniref:Uncharacterized protein n=1 Tax=Limnoglobus roseus TaxID=2598579 RepID=A0A5C1AKZ1_9BACT|nr:hypothetical protein [Limnoglobus roseus]QEL19901.1 hypothetical protein PX52LOC_06983 [Limnoglobus roseus]
MADESVVVELTADASGFERALAGSEASADAWAGTIYADVDKVAAKAEELRDAIATKLGGAFDAIKGKVAAAIPPIGSTFQTVSATIKGKFDEIGTAAGAALAKANAKVEPYVTAVKKYADTFKGLGTVEIGVKGGADLGKLLGGDVGKKIGSYAGAGVGTLAKAVETAVSGLKPVFDGIATTAQAAFQKAREKVAAIDFKGAFDKVATVAGAAWDEAASLADGAWGRVKSGVEKIGTAMSAVWGKAKTTVRDFLNSPEGSLQSLVTRVDTLSDKIANFGSGTKEKIAAFADMSSNDIGGELGGAAGGFLGQKLGLGDFGNRIGKSLGSGLGDVIDFKGVFAQANEFLKSLQPVFDQIKSWWGETFDDAKDAFNEIKDLASNIGIGELLKGDFEGVWTRLTEFVDQAVGKWGDFLASFVYRVAESMDNLWAIVRAPLANISNFVQNVLTRIGLMDETTEKWGDSLASVAKIGKEAFGLLGFSLGYLGGIFKVIGGYAIEFFVQPVLALVETVVSVVSKVLKKMGELLPGAAGRAFAAGSKEAEAWNEAIKNNREALDKVATDLKNTDIGADGLSFQEDVLNFFERGEKKTKEQRDKRAALPKPVEEVNNVGDRVASLFGGGTVQALLEGSRETQNAIAKIRSGSDSALEQVVKAGRDQADELAIANGKLSEQNRLLGKLVDKFDGIEAV